MTADPARRPPTATNPARRSTGGAWGMGMQLICPSRGRIQPSPAAVAVASPVDGIGGPIPRLSIFLFFLSKTGK